MFDLNGDTLMAQVLTDVIIANTKGDGKGDHFWDNGEANLLKSLILYVDQDPSCGPEERNLPAVYQMLTQTSEKQLGALFDRLPLSHPAKAPYNLFSQASNNVRAGIIPGLGTRLQVLQSEAVRQITKHSNIDLAEPGENKCIYYIILDDQNASLECGTVQGGPDGQAGREEFSICACIIIRNELYSALEYSTRRAAEMATDPAELPLSESGESPEQQMVCGDLLDRLERAEAAAGGVTVRGCQAIRLLAQGYSSRETGQRFGVQANHVTAWVAKARKQLALLA